MRLSPIQGADVAMETPTEKMAWIPAGVVDFLTAEAESKSPRETGGLLMGYFREPGNVPVIMCATGPGPQAIHLRNYYRPDYEFDEGEIASLYERSGRRITYVGDWHTHLAPYPELSARDKRTLRRIARFKAARLETPLMLVLSHDAQWDVTIWEGRLRKTRMWGKCLSVDKLIVEIV